MALRMLAGAYALDVPAEKMSILLEDAHNMQLPLNSQCWTFCLGTLGQGHTGCFMEHDCISRLLDRAKSVF
jgi:hypothetical protein